LKYSISLLNVKFGAAYLNFYNYPTQLLDFILILLLYPFFSKRLLM
jgi:hypothetical protein